MIFEDRISAYPNRYYMTDESGNTSYVILERADEPIRPGTPLNAETLDPKDISKNVSVSWYYASSVGATGGANLTALHIRNKKYIFYPSLKMVFFEFQIEYLGSAKAGELVLFEHTGGYTPINKNGVPVIVQKDSLSCGYNYVASLNSFMFSMYFREAFSNSEAQTASVCGWYFCDGE